MDSRSYNNEEEREEKKEEVRRPLWIDLKTAKEATKICRQREIQEKDEEIRRRRNSVPDTLRLPTWYGVDKSTQRQAFFENKYSAPAQSGNLSDVVEHQEHQTKLKKINKPGSSSY